MLSIALSPTPAILSVLDTRVWFCFNARYGFTCLENIGFISFGGPGIIIRILLLSSIIIPGAVPFSLYITVEFTGTIACLTLLSVIGLFILSKNFLILSRAFSSRISFRPKYSAPISFVRSSPVGPRPPVVIIMSALSKAMFMAVFILSGLSPTTVW